MVSPLIEDVLGFAHSIALFLHDEKKKERKKVGKVVVSLETSDHISVRFLNILVPNEMLELSGGLPHRKECTLGSSTVVPEQYDSF